MRKSQGRKKDPSDDVQLRRRLSQCAVACDGKVVTINDRSTLVTPVPGRSRPRGYGVTSVGGSPDATFVFLSGSGADRTPRSSASPPPA
jgi:hypothetical protein